MMMEAGNLLANLGINSEPLVDRQLKYVFNVRRYLGKIIQLTSIFQMGGNHQLVTELPDISGWVINHVVSSRADG